MWTHQVTKKLRAVATRFWPVAYWAVFAALVIDGARNPGLVISPVEPAYPTLTVGVELVLLALLILWLLRLSRYPARRRLLRWLELTGFMAIQLFLAAGLMYFDLSGDTYALAWFASFSILLYAAGAVRRGLQKNEVAVNKQAA